MMNQDNRAKKISDNILPTSEAAVHLYRTTTGSLTDPSQFGRDPLESDPSKQCIRENAFNGRFPSFETIFHNLVNSNCSLFKQALLFYIDVTRRLSTS